MSGHCGHCYREGDDYPLCGLEYSGYHADGYLLQALWVDDKCPACEAITDARQTIDALRAELARLEQESSATLECPDCGEHLPVRFRVEVGDVDSTGELQADAVADLSDLWAHAWTHGRIS